MKIYLARHGQSEWQLEPSDDWDTPLTPVGHEQAKRLAEWLAAQQGVDDPTRVEVASLCASTSRRAEQTAAYAADALGLALVTELGLREADFHVAEYLPTLETPLGPAEGAGLSVTYTAFKLQMKAALEWLVQQAEASGGPLLAVTHAGAIKTLLRIVCGSDSISFRLCNTGINLIEWRRIRWDLVYLNRWDHLPRELRTF